jgi:hypothetical protein
MEVTEISQGLVWHHEVVHYGLTPGVVGRVVVLGAVPAVQHAAITSQQEVTQILPICVGSEVHHFPVWNTIHSLHEVAAVATPAVEVPTYAETTVVTEGVDLAQQVIIELLHIDVSRRVLRWQITHADVEGESHIFAQQLYPQDVL